MSAEQTPDIERVLAEHEFDLSNVPVQRDEDGRITGYTLSCTCGFGFPPDPDVNHHRAHVAQALAPVLAAAVREAEQRATSIVRLVEQDMSEAATLAWRSAEARRGLSDYDALLVHADALTRWSERIRMALKGDDYRADRITEPVSHEAATSGKESKASDE